MISPRRAMTRRTGGHRAPPPGRPAPHRAAGSALAGGRDFGGAVRGEAGAQVARPRAQLGDGLAEGVEVARVDGREPAGDLPAGHGLDGQLVAHVACGLGEALTHIRSGLLRRLRRAGSC